MVEAVLSGIQTYSNTLSVQQVVLVNSYISYI